MNSVLFPKEPFSSLCELLGVFSEVDLVEHNRGDTLAFASADASAAGKEGSLIWHVANVVARFRSIVEVTTRYVPQSRATIDWGR